LSTRCAGPSETLEKTQEQISKKLSKLEESLAFEKRADAVASRRIHDDDADVAAPFKRRKEHVFQVANAKRPSQVDALTMFNYVEGLKKKTGLDKVNWSAVATVFKLKSGKAALAVYERYIAVVESMKPDNHDPAPHIHVLDLKRKRQLLSHAQSFEGGRVRQLTEDQWDAYIDGLRLEQYKEVENAPNANLDIIGKLCDQTYSKIKEWAVPAPKSTGKHLTEGRLDAQAEPRNPIAFASVVQAEMHDRPIAKELICSADMFTFWHDPGSGKTRWVRMTQKAAEQLRDQKLGPGYADDSDKKLVLGKGAIPVYGCIDASGEIVCLVEIFSDPAVPCVDPSVALYPMYPLQTLASFKNPAYNSFVFAAVVNSDFDEEALLQQIWETIIIPKQTKKAHDMLRARIAFTVPTVGLPTPSTSVSVSSRPANAANPANTSDRSIGGALRTPRRRPADEHEVQVSSPPATQLRRSQSHASDMAIRFGEHFDSCGQVSDTALQSPSTRTRSQTGAFSDAISSFPPVCFTATKSANPFVSLTAPKADPLVNPSGQVASPAIMRHGSPRTRSKRHFSQMSDHQQLEAAFQVVFSLVSAACCGQSVGNICAGGTLRS
jgi:hypothetical protein